MSLRSENRDVLISRVESLRSQYNILSNHYNGLENSYNRQHDKLQALAREITKILNGPDENMRKSLKQLQTDFFET